MPTDPPTEFARDVVVIECQPPLPPTNFATSRARRAVTLRRRRSVTAQSRLPHSPVMTTSRRVPFAPPTHVGRISHVGLPAEEKQDQQRHRAKTS